MKLNKATAKEVAKAGSSDFSTPLPPGAYTVKLLKCELSKKEGAAGPYWKLEFVVPKGYDGKGRHLWMNLSLSSAAQWRMAQFYKAFGDPDCISDTEDFINQLCIAQVGIETQNEGKGKGQQRNTIEKLLQADDELVEEEDDEEVEDEEEEPVPAKAKKKAVAVVSDDDDEEAEDDI